MSSNLQPGTSRQKSPIIESYELDNYEIENDRDRITDLQSTITPIETSDVQNSSTNQDIENIGEEKIDFLCESCGLNEKCDYFGDSPDFVSGGMFLRENCYVMRDPFSPPPPPGKKKAEYFLILGSACSQCGKIVCKDLTCSFFYEKTFCLNCIKVVMPSLPKEVQTKFKKQIERIKI